MKVKIFKIKIKLTIKLKLKKKPQAQAQEFILKVELHFFMIMVVLFEGGDEGFSNHVKTFLRSAHFFIFVGDSVSISVGLFRSHFSKITSLPGALSMIAVTF